MKICGLIKTTLLDFPEHVAATIFTGSCQFRCPFCQNSELLSDYAPAAYSEEEILSFLKKRSGILEGVAITGGEPTLQPDLESFICKVRSLGLLIKLDTNGYRPDVLKHLCSQQLIDYVAMDIKSCPSSYGKVSGISSLNLQPILESVDFLKTNTVPFEFRTTLVKELHSENDMLEIGKWISGPFPYFLQNYRDSEQVLTSGLHGFDAEELQSFLKLLKPYTPKVCLRGKD